MDRLARWLIPPLVLVVLALGFLVWDKRRSRGTAPAKTAASTRTTERPRLARPLKPGEKPSDRPAGTPGSPEEPPADSEIEDTVSENPVPDTVEGFLEELKGLQGDAARAHEAEDLLNEFFSLVEEDAEQRAKAIEAFKTTTDPALLEALAMTLGRVEAPEVRQTMAELARSDGPIERRKSALFALSYTQTDEILPISLQILRTEADAGLRASAIDAIPDFPPSDIPPDKRAEVAGRLVDLARAPEPEVRASALKQMGEWTDESATPVLIEGMRDPQTTVRFSAAVSLMMRADKNPAAREVFLEALRNAGEDREIRSIAADVLRAEAERNPQVRQAVEAFDAQDAEAHKDPQEQPKSGKIRD